MNRYLLLSFSLLLISIQLFAQPKALNPSNISNLFGYLKIPKNKVSIDRITSLVADVENVKRNETERVRDFKTLMAELATLMKLDTLGLDRYFTSWGKRIVRDSTQVFEIIDIGSLTSPIKLEIVKIGRGKQPVILIPEYRKNWSVYKDFAEQNSDEFTFYAITLPGYNGTSPLPLPSTYDFEKRVWLDKVVNELKRFIVDNRLEKPIVMGALNAGIYLSVTLATTSPNLVSGIVSLSGTISEDIDVPGISETERAIQVDNSFSNVVGHLLYRKKMTEQSIALRLRQKLQLKHPIYHYTRDTVKVKEVLRMHLSFPSITERYNVEWLTSDLSDEIAKLKVPMLVLYGVYDSGWPFAPDAGLQQWKTFKATSSKNNLELIEIPDTRLIMVLDQPQEVAKHLFTFAQKLKRP